MEEEIIFRVEVPGAEKAINSIENLTKANKALREERKKLDIDSDSGRARVQQINTQIDKNTELIKNNSSALEKQRLNIGNYKSALDGVAPGLSGFATGMYNMAKASLAFIATPIGAAIAAISLALAPLISFLTTTGEGMDIVTRETEGWNSVMRQLKDGINEAGKSSFEFLKTVLNSIPGVNSLSVAYNELAKAGREYADVLDEIEESQRVFDIIAAEEENNIKRLILQSKNRTLTEKERIDLIDQALHKEQELSDKRIEFADKELKAVITLAEAQTKTQQGYNQSIEQYGIELVKTLTNTDEELSKRVASALLKVKDAEGQSIAILEKAQNQRDALLDKQDQKAAKSAEDKRKKDEEERLKYAEFLRLQDEDRKQEVEDFNDFQRQKAKELEQDRIESARRVAQKEAEVERIKSGAISGLLKKVTGDRIDAQKLYTSIFKKGAFSETLVNAKAAAGAAYKALAGIPIVGPVLGAAAAVAAYAFGLSQALGIQAIQFARGGIAGTGGVLRGRSHANGGIPFSVGGRVGFEAEGGEAIINKKSTSMFRTQLSAINQAGGGRSFAVGGVPESSSISVGNISRASESSVSQREIFEAIAQLKIVATIEDINREQRRVEILDNRATVLS